MTARKKVPASISTDSTPRCWWCGTDPLYVRYHDKEWGVPVRSDRKMFEFLVLESFQSGLSWFTILKKRENFRKAFAQFNYEDVARFTDSDKARLLNDAGIVRNRAKIQAAINNAQRFIEVRNEYGTFSKYLWKFTDGETIRLPRGPKKGALRATSPESDAMAKDLKARGFSFLGSTVCYAHMQAVGMVDDHTVGCFKYVQR